MPVLGSSYDKEELANILYEKTDSPEFWLNYLENPTDPKVGKWLPELILKLNYSKTETEEVVYDQEKEIMEITYTTITKGYDWGPAINKLVLKPSVDIDSSTLNANSFTATSVRNFKVFDYTTYTVAEEATDNFNERNITKAYMSNEEGDFDLNGKHITLEMEVGPTLKEGAPLNYNVASNRNSYVSTYYSIALQEGANLKSFDGKFLELKPTTAVEYEKDIKLIADDFVNNQRYTLDNITLTYAHYKPESTNIEEGSNPLIIWLHGAGEGGIDTTLALLGTKTVNLATDDIQQYFGETGAYILTPQSPTMWMDFDGTNTYTSKVEGSDGQSYYTETLMGLIDEYVKNNPEIDRNRIYIGGNSNGGYMTINMIINYPEYFAAAFPICEAYSDSWLTEDKLDSIAKLPIWITHANNDPTVAIAKGEVNMSNYSYRLEYDENGNIIPIDDFSNALYRRLIEKGSDNVYYSLFDNVVDTTGLYFQKDGVTHYEYSGHWSWIYTLNNECVEIIDGVEVTIFDWLSRQSK